jgi:hypothetical protein
MPVGQMFLDKSMVPTQCFVRTGITFHFTDSRWVAAMTGRHTLWSAVLFGGYLFMFTQQKAGKMSIGRMFLTKRRETNELLLLLLNFTNC